jgi:hypothetical protein
MSEPVIGAIYEHYKGKRYRVHGVVRHSETLELLVYYETLYPCELGQFWVRPLELFLGTTIVGGREVRRFKLVSS